MTPVEPSLRLTPVEPPLLPPSRIPAHVAVVMDGNGRWAEQRGLSRSDGHWTALARMFETVDAALSVGVKWLSVFAFSSENWQRSTDEVEGLLGCISGMAGEHADEIVKRGIRFRWCGSPQGLPGALVEDLHRLEKATASGTAINCTLCCNYGGRSDIVRATQKAMEMAKAGHLDPQDLNEAALARLMLTRDLPDIDLLIRSGGEQRLSNFMLWQCAYAEITFLPDLWPDVTQELLWQAITDYARRDRRFGAAPTPAKPAHSVH
ncbi:polyprenyl diphosphate synthase [Streptomyces clavifer]|uniref:polyprenyl diphosphate synthase n=1 Tax=Streptomyces clavifer TaxID=68188 RepID=UPI00365C8B48